MHDGAVFRSFATNVFILCCYVTLHIQHAQPLNDEKNEKNNQMKDVFFFDILCFTIHDCILNFVSIINLFLWKLLPKSSFKREKHEQCCSNNALLSICTIKNVFRRTNNSNFQFSNINVTFITEQKTLQGLFLCEKKRE